MKRIKFFAVAACLAISSGAYAQFTNSSSHSSSANVNTDEWSTIWVEYNPMNLEYDTKGADDQSLTGFSAGYSRAFSLSQSAPLFLEAGLGLQYANFSESLDEYYEDYEMKFSMWSVKAPVNLLYNFAIPNSSISLAPFAGITLRYNVSGTLKYETDDDSEKCNIFDKGDMEEAWKRFQIGWQIGVKARFGQNFMAGLSYGSDFSEIAKKTKLQTTSLTIGYTF
ncbi:MAG: PorT family protein [Bacteroidaceae bacterium]|nr:PorT family protein [Bacteroidaceae bacterium]